MSPLRTRVGRFNNNMFRWGLAKLPFCNLGPETQTAEHLIYPCPIHRSQVGNMDLTVPEVTTVQWLQRLEITSRSPVLHAQKEDPNCQSLLFSRRFSC